LITDETGAVPLFSRTSRTICVPASLVPYVRTGLIAEFASATDVLGDALMDEADRERWNAGLTPLDCARELLSAVGICARAGECALILGVASPRLARMLLDALRAVCDVKIVGLGNTLADRVAIPVQEVPNLRSFIAGAERRRCGATKRQPPLLGTPDKRAPRSEELNR
jgi:hypothetical protein